LLAARLELYSEAKRHGLNLLKNKEKKKKRKKKGKKIKKNKKKKGKNKEKLLYCCEMIVMYKKPQWGKI
jgi:hypothetical protein